MARICSLRPNVTKEEAAEAFSADGPLAWMRELVSGPMRSVADFYIPFRLYRVEIVNKGRPSHRILGLDAVNGTLDPYHFEQLPRAQDVIYRETRNCAPAVLDDDRAQEMIVSKVRRLIFTTGFFRVRGLRISAAPIAGEVYVPYWVGFRGRGAQTHFAVLDAFRQRMEGAKVRRLLENWLLSLH
jgi:hypothetical protein